MIKEPVQPHLLLLLSQPLHHFRGLCQHGQRCRGTTTAGVGAGQQQADATLCNGVLTQFRTALRTIKPIHNRECTSVSNCTILTLKDKSQAPL